jgi:hypothetical protein
MIIEVIFAAEMPMYLDGSTEKRKRKGTVDVLDYYSK